MQRCWLTTELGNEIRRAVVGWARDNSVRAYSQAEERGYLRHLVVREGRNTGQALVVLVTAPGDLPAREELVATLRRFPEVRSVHWAVNSGPAEVTNLPTMLLHGDEAIEEHTGARLRVGRMRYCRPTTSDFPNADEGRRRLRAPGRARDRTSYCGIGSIG